MEDLEPMDSSLSLQRGQRIQVPNVKQTLGLRARKEKERERLSRHEGKPTIKGVLHSPPLLPLHFLLFLAPTHSLSLLYRMDFNPSNKLYI